MDGLEPVPVEDGAGLFWTAFLPFPNSANCLSNVWIANFPKPFAVDQKQFSQENSVQF